MQSKRGLSTVITTLIIILLVLVAVGIVWVVIRNVIFEGTEGIELGKFTTDLEIKNVIVGENVSVNVKRNPGKGDLGGIKFIFYEGDNSEVIEKNISLEELEERTFVFLSEDLGEINISNIAKVSIAGIFKSDSGKESAGNVVDSYGIGEGSGEPCIPNCSCNSTICVGKTCTDPVCGIDCDGILEPDCGTRVCGPAPNGCGNESVCGTCDLGSDCVDGNCESEFGCTDKTIEGGSIVNGGSGEFTTDDVVACNGTWTSIGMRNCTDESTNDACDLCAEGWHLCGINDADNPTWKDNEICGKITVGECTGSTGLTGWFNTAAHEVFRTSPYYSCQECGSGLTSVGCGTGGYFYTSFSWGSCGPTGTKIEGAQRRWIINATNNMGVCDAAVNSNPANGVLCCKNSAT